MSTKHYFSLIFTLNFEMMIPVLQIQFNELLDLIESI